VHDNGVKTVILCGGKGTRAYPHTVDLPKPLLEVADRPILEHVMAIYAEQGFTEFVLAAGFRADLVVEFSEGLPRDWEVDVVDTGADTNTGGRVVKVRERVGDEFFLTYGDGVGDIDLAALLDKHRSHAGGMTVTTVPLPSQYGTIVFDGAGCVTEFREKPKLPDHWINAGFMVVSHSAFDHWSGEDLEREVMPALGHAGELYVYNHRGFWKSMDTYKDGLELTSLCAPTDDNPRGTPPWLRSTAPLS
jgi:glucose-1-phosphate cytidylyltransferase